MPASAGFVPNLSSLEDAENGTPGPQAGPDRDPQAFSGTVLKTPAGTLRVGSKNRAMTTTSPYPTGSSGPGNSTHPIIAGQATTTFTIVPQHEAQLYLAFKNNRQGIEEYLTNKTEIEAFLKNKSAFEAYMEKKEENDILMQTLQRSQHDLPGDEMLTESGTTPVRPVHTTTPTSESNEGAWQGVKYPNKGHDIKMDQSQPSKPAKGKPPTQTIVLKPTCKQSVHTFKGRDIYSAIEKTGIRNKDGYSVHMNEKSNTIAITTKNPLITSKLLSIGQIEKGQKSYEVTPYMAISSNEVRGVIYLHGNDVNETPESLMEGLDCHTHNIIAARPIGKTGKTILVTFEGKVIPKKVRFLCEVLSVAEYRPRPLVCFTCHKLGHKSDVCPSTTKKCDKCGHTHGDIDDCELEPKCNNCGGPHIATSNDCPKRQIPPRRKPTRRLPPNPRSPGNANKTEESWPSLPENAWSTPFRFATGTPPMVFGRTQEETPSSMKHTTVSPGNFPGDVDWMKFNEARMTRLEAKHDAMESAIHEIKSMLANIINRFNR